MTTGTLLFYGGLALLALTVILAVIFALRPPKYTPENAAIIAPGDTQTQPLKNGYPTNRLTVRREPNPPAGPAPFPPGPQAPAGPGPGPQTALLNAPVPPGPGPQTALLNAPVPPGPGPQTAFLPPSAGTAFLDPSAAPPPPSDPLQ